MKKQQLTLFDPKNALTNENSWSIFTLLFIIAFVSSIYLKTTWTTLLEDYGLASNSTYHGQYIISNNDGFFFATGAKELFENGQTITKRAPGFSEGLVFMTYALQKMGFKIEDIMLYSSTVMSSFLALIVMLIGRLYGHTLLGFYAGFLSCITWSYYNRTLAGYFDTDMFSVTVVILALYLLLKIYKDPKPKYALYLCLNIYMGVWLYNSSLSVLIGLLFCFLGLLVADFFVRWYSFKEKPVDLKKRFEPFLQAVCIVFMGAIASNIIELSMSGLHWKHIFMLAAFTLFVVFQTKSISCSALLYLAAISLLVFFILADNPIAEKLGLYLKIAQNTQSSLHFQTVIQTIAEASSIPFKVVANRISGHTISLLLGFLGFMTLCFRKKEFLIAMVLVGLGLASSKIGLRFTIYAIVPLWIGLFFTLYFLLYEQLKVRFAQGIIFVLFVLFALPNLNHINGFFDEKAVYFSPPTFSSEQARALNQLSTIAEPQDYAVAWWDYGYPIWFYGKINTLIDGGKHEQDNYIIAKALMTSSPKLSINLAQAGFDAYETKQIRHSSLGINIFFNEDSSAKDVNEMLQNFGRNFYVPKNPRTLYYVLPKQMLRILPVLKSFENRNLNSDKVFRSPLFVAVNALFTKTAIYSQLGTVTLSPLIIQTNSGKIPLKNLIVTRRTNPNAPLEQKWYRGNPQSPYTVIYISDLGQFILTQGDEYLDSLAFKMFVFENYDKDFFEPIFLGREIKIYKAKNFSTFLQRCL